jgi:predicted aspartyl protease
MKSALFYSVLAACSLAANASALTTADNHGKASVKAESAIFSSMSSRSEAVKSIKMGEIVMIEFEVSGPEGRWCGVLEQGRSTISGYMECKYLEREKPGETSWTSLGSSREEKGGNTTKVVIKGNMVFVPAKIAYEDNSIEVMLLLDTGASHTIINAEIADRLKINPAKTNKVQVQVVGGALVNVRVAKLRYLSVDPHIKNDLVVGIIEEKAAPVKYDGLLGMDFLKNLNYRIDFGEMLIHWN